MSTTSHVFALPIEQIEAINDLNKKIAKLPTINLKDKQLNKIAYFIDFNDIISVEQLTACLKVEEGQWLLAEPHSQEIINYLKDWLTLGALLLDCVKYLNQIWRQKNKSPFGSDNLVLLFIELLPNEKSQLSELLKKLNLAIQMSVASVYACHLTNLYVAVNAKLENLDFDTGAEIKSVVEEIKNSALIAHLHMTCLQQMDDLLTTFKKKRPQAILPPLPIPETEELAIEAYNAFIDQTPETPEVEELIEQYKLIWDLNISLVRERTSAKHKLKEFNAKFEHVQQIINPLLDKSFLQKMALVFNPEILRNFFIRQPAPTPSKNNTFNFFARKRAESPVVMPNVSAVMPSVSEETRDDSRDPSLRSG